MEIVITVLCFVFLIIEAFLAVLMMAAGDIKRVFVIGFATGAIHFATFVYTLIKFPTWVPIMTGSLQLVLICVLGLYIRSLNLKGFDEL